MAVWEVLNVVHYMITLSLSLFSHSFHFSIYGFAIPDSDVWRLLE